MDSDDAHAPFDMLKETLKSIRKWIDDIVKLSTCILGGERIDPNEMIVHKHRMVKGLIVLATSLIIKDLEEIEDFYNGIELDRGNVKSGSGIYRNVPVYSIKVDYQLDECVQAVQKSLEKYFTPKVVDGEAY